MTVTILKTLASALVACAVGATVLGFAPAAAPVPKDAGKATDGIADAKQRLRSKNNLRQILIALHNYHDVNNAFPTNIVDKNGKELLSWRVHLLPYLEQDALYKAFKLDEPWDSDTNKKLLAKMPDVFRVGIEEKGATKTYYQGFAGPGAAFEPGKKLTFAQITDGTSATIGVIEAGPPVEWTKPADIAYDPAKAFPKLDGPFKNVVLVATLDGATYTFKPDLKDAEFHDFVQVADGNVADVDKAKADLPALTKEDKEFAAKLQQENIELVKQFGAMLDERQKLLAELVKKPGAGGPDLEKLAAEQEGLRRELQQLKAQIEKLKEELEKK